MSQTRGFRFGVSAQPLDTADDWRALARKVEDLGYSTLFLPDHLGKQLAPMPALAVAAEATSRLRVGVLVAANDFRHPVLHAKEIATLDLLSDGRVEWGVGAGWLEPEYQAAGIPFDLAELRVSRLEEAVTVMRGLFGDDPVHHHGDHYQVDGLEGFPKPIQRPHPPLLVGAAQHRMLSFAARAADIVGVAPSPTSQSVDGDPPRHTVVEAVDRQVEWVRGAASERFDELELNMVAFPVAVTNEREQRAERVAPHIRLPPDQVLASPHVILGTVEQICEQLEAHRQRWGVSYWVVPARSAGALSPVVARLTGH